jgi:leucyl-tRNA synthetase
MYIGGIEHAILHLLYARFFTKVLYDLKYINFDEPFLRLFNQGMVCRNGAKMSKSKGNVVSPDELVEKYGTDTVRLYELFIGPPEQDAEWSDRGIEGIHRFLNRVWKLVNANLHVSDQSSESVLRQRHLLVKNVTEGLESFKFNTTISRFMEFVNFAYGLEKEHLDSQTIDAFLILLSPFAPHMAEELWQQRGHQRSIFGVEWPTYNQTFTKPQQITLVVQVNGKVRAKLQVDADIDQQEAERLALEAPNVKVHLSGRAPRKVIIVPKRIVNIVV